MIAPRHSKPKPEPGREHERKQRRCLKCRKLFMSDWLAFHHPEWMTETYRKVIEDRIPVDGRREIRALNKNEFFKLMIRARTEARYKGRI